MAIDWVALVVSIFLAEGAGFIGSLYTRPAIPGWYQGLKKSPLNPPAWVFAPVWTTLYLLMAIAAYLVYVSGAEPILMEEALVLYAIQLVLNAAWSGIFFGMKRLRLAFFELVLLWITIAATIDIFVQISHTAALLLAPYLAWVTFAGYLNYTTMKLNS